MKESQILTNEEPLLQEEQKSVQELQEAPQKSKSWQVIFATGNCMIGSGSLFVALYAKKSGIIQVPLLILIMGFITGKTCWQVIQHMRPKDTWSTLVQRILGDKYKTIAEWSHASLYFFAIFSTFLLAVNILFNAFVYIFQKLNYTGYGDRNEVKFTSISFTWLVLILSLIIFKLCQIRNIKLVIMLGSYGPIAAILYLVFIFVSFVSNVSSGALTNPKNVEPINFFTFNATDFFELLAILSMSMSVHSLSVNFFQQNENQANNRRDNRLAFLMPVGIFLFVSILGYIAIYGKTCPTENTIFDYFLNDMSFFTFIVLVVYFCQLLSVEATLIYEAKTMLFRLINNAYGLPADANFNSKEKMFTFIVPAICISLGIFNTKPKTALALIGALSGYFFIYHIPVFMHLTCLYGKKFLTISYVKEVVVKKQQKMIELKQLNAKQITNNNNNNSNNNVNNNVNNNQEDNIIEVNNNANNQLYGSPVTMDTTRNSIKFSPNLNQQQQEIIIESKEEEDDDAECEHVKHISNAPKATRIILNLAVVALGEMILLSQLLGIIVKFL